LSDLSCNKFPQREIGFIFLTDDKLFNIVSPRTQKLSDRLDVARSVLSMLAVLLSEKVIFNNTLS